MTPPVRLITSQVAPREFRNHHSSRWSLLRTPQLTLNFPDQIRKDMKDVREAIKTLRERTDPHSRWLGLPEVESKEDIGTMTQLLQLLTQAPTSGIPGVWLDRNTAKRLIQVSEDRARQQQERRHLEKMLSSWFGNPLPLNLDYQAVKKAADLTSSEQEVIEDGIGIGWRTAIGPSPSALSDAATALSTALKTLSAEAKALAETLGGRECQTLGQIDETCKMAARILAIDPVPEEWLQILCDRYPEAPGRESPLITQYTRRG